MATILKGLRRERSKLAEDAQPQGSLRFDWMAAGVSSVLIGGMYLDGWAHEHGKVDQSFFTPWHAVLYSGFGLVALFFGLTFVRNVLHGYRWERALPLGYGLSLLGVVIFLLGGPTDLLWHTLFGFEANVDALLSPSHLLLAVGAMLMISGSFRSTWHRTTPENTNWRTLGSALVSLMLMHSLLTFFTQYAHPFVSPWPYQASTRAVIDGDLTQIYGIVGILIQSGLMVGLVLLALGRWLLPIGSITFILTLNALLVCVLRDGYRFIPVALIAGLVSDLLLHLLKPSVVRPLALHVWAFLMPTAVWSIYFATLFLTGGVAWSIHLWMGAIMLGGVVGLFLSYLLVPPSRAATTS